MTITNTDQLEVPVRSIGFSSYELSPRAALGRLSADKPRQGAVLKVQFEDDIVGYADCHPWPELGDLPLSDQLECLKSLTSSKATSLGNRSLEFARMDGEARARGRSLWEGLQIPASHALLNNAQQLTAADLELKAQQGFKHLKIKMGIHPRQEANALLALAPVFKELSFKLRLDFNAGLSPIQFEEFLENLGEVREFIDYIEDPTVYDPRVWAQAQRRWGIRLALDRLSDETISILAPHSFSVLVFKPAIQKADTIFQLAEKFRASIVVTSYLDHPVGQLCAARVAAQASIRPEIVVETCGLLSHMAYESHPFSEEMKTSGPFLLGPQGTGFGMDAALSELKWEQL
ncbi:MAG: enolase C-terminal domain-like protein [Bdellovibrionia bacterium]